jgi:arabinan endo-1,5-alpha-L-arabinosidase
LIADEASAPLIQSTDKPDYNCIDPSAFLSENGDLYIAFGSFWSGIRMIQLDPETGKRSAPDSKTTSWPTTNPSKPLRLFP